MRTCTVNLVISAVIAIAVVTSSIAQDGGAPAAEPQTLRELIDASLSWYEVFPNSESKEPAEALAVLRWANNTRGSQDGVTALFVHGGRPLAVACVYPWDQRLEYGFESLSRTRSIVARRGGAVVWQPQEPGAEFADIPGAPPVEPTRAQRLRQMKILAEKFHGTMLGWKKDNSDREELRLLARPLYRYDPKEGQIVDGAVFAFAMGTDPEILLLIEAAKDAGSDAARWQYGFVRRTSGELEARFGDRVVWHVDRFPTQNDPQRSYFTIGTPLPPGLAAKERKSL